LKLLTELRLQLLRRGAQRKTSLHVLIGAPQPDGDRAWYCPVRLKGISGKERRIIGIDSWQALILGIRFVELMLRREIREGGQLFWLGHKVRVGALFATGVRA
jgi:hypothetical protein